MDAAILEWIHRHSTPALDAAFRFSDELGRFRFCAAFVGTMALWHLARRERRAALAWIGVGLAVGWLPEIVKALTARLRPELWPRLVEASGYSFPSGHATAGAALFPLLAFLAGRAWPGASRAAWALGLGLGAFVGLGRLYLGVHWPSDVVAGWVLGALLCAGTIRWLERATSGTHAPDERSTPRPQAGTRWGSG